MTTIGKLRIKAEQNEFTHRIKIPVSEAERKPSHGILQGRRMPMETRLSMNMKKTAVMFTLLLFITQVSAERKETTKSSSTTIITERKSERMCAWTRGQGKS